MNTIDYVIFGILISACLIIGISWLVTKGNFVHHTRELTKDESNVLHKRSILAGVFYILMSVVLAVAMVAMNYNISWLLITCFVLLIVCSMSFIVLSRLIYRRRV